jgi:copper(I)-binding protein
VSRWTTRSAGGTGRRAGTLITLGLAGAFALTGCSAGQVAETAIKVPAIPGVDAKVGDIAIRNALIAFPSEGYDWASGSSVPLSVRLINNGNTADRLISASSDLSSSIVLQVVPEGGQATTAPSESPSAAVSETVSPSAGATTGGEATPSGPVVTGTPEPTLSNGQPSPAPSRGTPSPVVDSPIPTASPGAALPLDLPARKLVDLEVGGPQLVLTAISEKIDPATVVAVTLTFERAGDVTLRVPFAPPGTPLPRESVSHAGEDAEGGHE